MRGDNDLPAPLVPPEVDLRGLTFMPLDIQRLLDSDFYAKANGDEFKAAITLWCKAFLQLPAGSLPDDDQVLARLSGADGRWPKVRAVALRGFVRCADGRLYHPVVAEKVIETWRYRKAQRDRARKRWKCDATAVPRHEENESHGNATAVPGQCHGDASRSGLDGGGVEVPPPSPTTPSSSASSERARAREDGAGNGD